MAPASDLAESLLNNPDRPPVSSIDGKRVIFQNTAIPHLNEADEGAAIDMVVNSRVWKELDLDPSTTLHDVRWGEHWKGLAYTDSTNQKEIDDFVWLFMISGAIPASHFQNGYAEAYSYRQPPTSFIQGGGTVTGISKPGEFVWSRVYIKANTLRVDIGRGTSLRLPPEETVRRWKETTPEWPMMNAILHGVSRDQFMARHMSNHITITYASSPEQADRALAIKAAMMKRMGLDVYICGKNTIH
jgi:L-fucose isomerase-like protein